VNSYDLTLLILLPALLIATTPFAGSWMVRVLEGEIPNFLKWIGHLETLLYRLLGINPHKDMSWRQYALALVSFNLAGIVILLGLLSFQSFLPLNPQHVGNLDLGVALNTAVSFVTNTNWQTYAGESQLSYFSQMLGLGVQNFLSAATGITVIAALARGLRQNQVSGLGNFWADLTRTTLYVLLPFCFILAVVLLSQGVVMSFRPYAVAHTLEGATQTIPLGPAASQIAIKQIGTNGGGFFGANSAHPFENPTPLTNFLEIFAMLFLPAACVDAFGRMTKAHKHAWAILAVMGLFLTSAIAWSLYAETHPANDLMEAGKNITMEGKETRHGVVSSVVWSQVTTATSTGATNASQGSLSPITTGVACLNMLLGEIVFGGVGSGLYGMVMMITLTVFLAGLMVGRTPEYLGKKIESHEVCAAAIAVLLPCGLVLLGCVGSFYLEAGRSGIGSHGPHAITEVLYGWASMANNNGSAMGTLDATKPFYLWAGSLVMILGRFGVILPVLYFAGSMSQKRLTPPSAGTFPTDGIVFCILLAGMILIIAGLTYFPALTIGPFLEHLLTKSGQTF
jgi:potassium-transporting ATPase potassium-binding subunit